MYISDKFNLPNANYQCSRIYKTEDNSTLIAVIDHNEVIFCEIDQEKINLAGVEYISRKPYPTMRAVNLCGFGQLIGKTLQNDDLKFVIEMDRSTISKGKVAWCILWFIYLGIFDYDNAYYYNRIVDYVSNQGWPTYFE